MMHEGLVNVWAIFAAGSLAGRRARWRRRDGSGSDEAVIDGAAKDADEMISKLIGRFPNESPGAGQ